MAGGARKEVHDALAALTAHRETVDGDTRAMLDQVIELLGSLGDEVSELSERVRWLIGAPYRTKSENVAPGQLAMDLLNALAFNRSAEGLESKPEPVKPDKEKKKRKRRGKELPVKVIISRLDAEQRACPCCSKQRAELPPTSGDGSSSSRRRRTRSRSTPTSTRATTAMPAWRALQRRCRPSRFPEAWRRRRMLAHLVVAKIVDGLPIERVARQLRRHGVDLATSTLNDWFGRTAQMLAFLHRLLRSELQQSELISLDDTPLKAQNRGSPDDDSPGTGKTIVRRRQWLYIGDIDRVAYAEFTQDWKGKHPRAVLEDFTGKVQGDGYGGINPLFGSAGGPIRVGCNDHARRKFVGGLKGGDSRAQDVVDIYRALYAVERRATERELDADGRAALRQEKSVPLWARLESAVGALAPQAGTKSPLGKAVVYFERQLPTLKVFLSDGRVPISNVHVERLLRTVAIFRNNSLFVGSIAAGGRYAVLLSLMLECRLAGINPYDYLVDVIDKVANDWPASRAGELLPRPWYAARQREQQVPGDTAGAAIGVAAVNC